MIESVYRLTLLVAKIDRMFSSLVHAVGLNECEHFLKGNLDWYEIDWSRLDRPWYMNDLYNNIFSNQSACLQIIPVWPMSMHDWGRLYEVR